MYIVENDKKLHNIDIILPLLIGKPSGKEIYYAFLDIPRYWSVRATGGYGSIYSGDILKAKVYFTEPVIKRNTLRVEWIEDNKICRIDYYGVYGYKYLSEYIEDGFIYKYEYYNTNSELRLAVFPDREMYHLYENGRLKKIYSSMEELIRSFYPEADIHFEAMILTNTDRLEGIEKCMEEFNDIHFSIAANTRMSDKLNVYSEKYENVSLYPCVTDNDRVSLMKAADFYLDITHGPEVYDSVAHAARTKSIILAYDKTARNRAKTLPECVMSSVPDFMQLLSRLVADDEFRTMLIKRQSLL